MGVLQGGGEAKSDAKEKEKKKKTNLTTAVALRQDHKNKSVK